MSSHAARPRNRPCIACGSTFWAAHSANGDEVWACDRCHKPSSLTADEWAAQQSAARAIADAHLRAADAAAAAEPKPRARLAEVLEKRLEANALIVKLDRGVPVARAAVTEAEERYNRAVEALAEGEAAATEGIAVAFYEGKKPGPTASVAAARRELDEATFARVAARNAKTLLDGKIAEARTAMGYANDRARKAAHGVLAAEQLEDLLAAATESRALYLESIGRLGWLLRHHMIPTDDARARQLVAGADTPPSSWPEAKAAGVQVMEAALATLLADPAAAI